MVRKRNAPSGPVMTWPRYRKPMLSYSPLSSACQRSTTAPRSRRQLLVSTKPESSNRRPPAPGRSKVTVASRRKKLTIFFSDLEGFTETTERLESEDLTQLLNHYLTEMSKIALQFGGTIDKYVGDAILIFFGDPDTKGVKADAIACVKMAVAMRKRMRELESVWRASGIEKPPRCRTGINTGFCTVGNFGSEDRMDYTIIGSGVNLACRLEATATPGEILISYETFALVKDEVCC